MTTKPADSIILVVKKMDKKILTIQDISCFGQCSLTVALPILSACGIETAVLPSAVLSNHTAFKEFTFCDLTDQMPSIRKSWENQEIGFSAVYTGYLGSTKQIDFVKDIMQSRLGKDGVRIVDPAMADLGKLYTGFDQIYVAEMKELCRSADIILPNITEACLLTGMPYKESFDKEYVEELIFALKKNFSAKIILTGVGVKTGTTGVAVYDGTNTEYYEHTKIGMGSHGTGDVFASAFTGAYMHGKSIFEAAKIAADFTVLCIKSTGPEHWYGVSFEKCLPDLINMLK